MDFKIRLFLNVTLKLFLFYMNRIFDLYIFLIMTWMLNVMMKMYVTLNHGKVMNEREERVHVRWRCFVVQFVCSLSSFNVSDKHLAEVYWIALSIMTKVARWTILIGNLLWTVLEYKEKAKLVNIIKLLMI